jgi:Cft2 family RNA processing exonuclease
VVAAVAQFLVATTRFTVDYDDENEHDNRHDSENNTKHNIQKSGQTHHTVVWRTTRLMESGFSLPLHFKTTVGIE